MMNTEQLTELIRKAVQEVTGGIPSVSPAVDPGEVPGPSWLYLTRPTPRSIST